VKNMDRGDGVGNQCDDAAGLGQCGPTPIGPAGVGIANIGGEEFEEAIRDMVTSGGNNRRGVLRGDDGSWFMTLRLRASQIASAER
jgi:hypothetical protein